MGCRQRWQPGAQFCANCGWIPPQLEIRYGETPIHAALGARWWWIATFIGGLMAIPVACTHQANIFVGEMVSHGSYSHANDSFAEDAAFLCSVVLTFISILIAIVRVIRGEPKTVSKLALSIFAFLFACLSVFITTPFH